MVTSSEDGFEFTFVFFDIKQTVFDFFLVSIFVLLDL